MKVLSKSPLKALSASATAAILMTAASAAHADFCQTACYAAASAAAFSAQAGIVASGSVGCSKAPPQAQSACNAAVQAAAASIGSMVGASVNSACSAQFC